MRNMKTISEKMLHENLRYFRKIHIFKNYYLVSIYATKSRIDGKWHWTLFNVIHYPLTFVYKLIKVVKN